MCNKEQATTSALVAFNGMKSSLGDQHHISPSSVVAASQSPTVLNSSGGFHTPGMPVFADYHQRLQFFDYATNRLRITGHPGLGHYALSPYGPVVHESQMPYGMAPFIRFDPRGRFVQEEPKPQHSYIGLIAMAILSIPDKKMVLSDIYQYILDNYPYFRNRGPGWRNSIRHNLSLNDCFIKAGRSANGKGHYWAIHPANVEDFKKGDFRRRKAQRKVRKHMGLSVPDDDDSPSPTPPPPDILHHHLHQVATSSPCLEATAPLPAPKKRLFDVESLLAPDNPPTSHLRHDPVHPLNPKQENKLEITEITSPPRSPDDGRQIEPYESDVEIDVTDITGEESVIRRSETSPWISPAVRSSTVNPSPRLCPSGPLNLPWPHNLFTYNALIRSQQETVSDGLRLAALSQMQHRRWTGKADLKPE